MRTVRVSSALLAFVAMGAVAQERSPSSPIPPSDQEEFLRRAAIVGARASERKAWRTTLDDGARRHDASVNTGDGSDGFEGHYRFNVAAYELDKVLGLGLVAPSIERTIDGKPASLTWWVDDFALSEVARRTKKIDPPDANRWNAQFHAVRVFDELTANAYRSMKPESYLTSLWDNLLITKDWRIWLIDHTRTFQSATQLQNPESLSRCDRTLLRRLRELSLETLSAKLGRYLSAAQLDALDARRRLLVKHFDEQIARSGEPSVLYDLAWMPR